MTKTMVVLAAGTLLASAVPAMAVTRGEGGGDRALPVTARTCGNEVDSLPQRIQTLQTAIRDHADDFSAKELQVLEDKLADAQETLNSLLHR